MYAIRSYYAGAFSLQAQQTISPADTGFDGFFMARLRRES